MTVRRSCVRIEEANRMDAILEQAAGWLLGATHAKVFLGVWLAVVLIYGIRRSLGDAQQDTIREAGPGA
jgi:hypothetical protein